MSQAAEKKPEQEQGRKYEVICVFNTKGTKKALEDMITQVGNVMKNSKAKLFGHEDMGKKNFAYNARKLESGHYINFSIQAPNTFTDNFRAAVQLNKDIHLLYIQKV